MSRDEKLTSGVPGWWLAACAAVGSGWVLPSPVALGADLSPQPDTPVAMTDDESMHWKTEVAHLTKATLEKIESFSEAAWRRFARRMQFSKPRQIVAYAGYGNERHVWVEGRVLANKPVRGPEDDDSWWDNLRATYERWETDEVPGVEVELIYGSQVKIAVTDEEGYYRATFDIDPEFPRDNIVFARMQGPRGALVAQHEITIPDPGAPFMVISDMDDTVIHTGITDVLLAARLTFLNNAKTRKPLAGVAGLYRQIAAGAGEDAGVPIFYVSNSGWNMYDLLRDFVDLNDIPQGPILLRDLGLNPAERDTTNHKAETFRQLLERYADLKALLIGDSGQHDAELYAAVARDFPDRIIAIYIRDVDPDHDSAYDTKVDAVIRDHSGTGVPMLRGRNSEVFAAHMAEIGILPRAAKPAVAASVDRDQERDKLTEL